MIEKKFIEGIFIEEIKHRFYCLVQVGSEIEKCYLSSPSKLCNMIDIVGRKVLLILNCSKNAKTKYILYAAIIEGEYYLVNLSEVNILVEEQLKKEGVSDSLRREYKLPQLSYKADFIEVNENKVYEIKGVLAARKSAKYPSVKLVRGLKQLEALEELISKRYEVEFIFVFMSPSLTELLLNEDHENVFNAFRKLITMGMKVKIYKISWKKGFCLTREIQSERQFIEHYQKEKYC